MHPGWLAYPEDVRRKLARMAVFSLAPILAEEADLFAGEIDRLFKNDVTASQAVHAFAAHLRALSATDKRLSLRDAERDLLERATARSSSY